MLPYCLDMFLTVLNAPYCLDFVGCWRRVLLLHLRHIGIAIAASDDDYYYDYYCYSYYFTGLYDLRSWWRA